MKDTGGNEIPERIHCDCGLTGGCKKCNPLYQGQKLLDITTPKKIIQEPFSADKFFLSAE